MDHLVHIEEVGAFRKSAEKGPKHRAHQPFGGVHTARAEKVAALSYVRQCIDGNVVQQLAHAMTGLRLSAARSCGPW
jgi:hypothetical protein